MILWAFEFANISSSQITMIEKHALLFLQRTNVFDNTTIVQVLCGFFSFFMTILVLLMYKL
jgi:hypothetical protein